MVNYNDPAVVVQDACAYGFADKFRVLGELADSLQQGQLQCSGMSWLVSTCVFALPRGPLPS
jgi:hypothetical protein